MDIEGIERHKYNFRLFCMFLKGEHKYQKFKKLMFTNYERTPNDLFYDMNKARLASILTGLGGDYCEIDRKWSAVFSYKPFCKFSWGLMAPVYYEMMQLTHKWCVFLMENNYDKQKR